MYAAALARSLYFTSRRRARMSKETVKGFNGQKGFGFIQPEDGRKDAFVRISAVRKCGNNRR